MSAGVMLAIGVSSVAFLDLWLWSEGGILGLVLDILLSISLLLGLIGFYGLWRNYGSGIGAATFGYGFAAIIVYIIGAVSIEYATYTYCYSYYYGNYCYTSVPSWAVVLAVTSLILVGVLFILQGVAFINVRSFTRDSGASAAAGIVMIVGGAFFCSLILSFVASFILVPAMIIGGIVLIRANTPMMTKGSTPVHAPQAQTMYGYYVPTQTGGQIESGYPIGRQGPPPPD